MHSYVLEQGEPVIKILSSKFLVAGLRKGQTLYTGMEITGIASQFAMQSWLICDASSNMRRKHCDALLGYSTLLF